MNIQNEIMALDALNPVAKDSGQYGPTWWIQGRFKDGGLFSRGAKSLDRAHALHADLTALIGKPGTYEVEPKGEYNGTPKFQLVSWPGKPEQQGGGFRGKPGGGGFVPRYRDTEEGFAREQASIHRSVALQRAVEFIGDYGKEPGEVLSCADRFYSWLSIPVVVQVKAQQPEQAAPQAKAEAPQTHPVPAPAAPTSKPPCPSCGKIDFVLNERDDAGKDKPGSFFCWKNTGKNKLGCGHKWVDVRHLAAASGMTTGDPLLTATQRYEAEIDKAMQAKDDARIQKLAGLIHQSHEAGSVSLDDAELLSSRLADATRIIKSATEHAAWYKAKQKEAGERLPEGLRDQAEFF